MCFSSELSHKAYMGSTVENEPSQVIRSKCWLVWRERHWGFFWIRPTDIIFSENAFVYGLFLECVSSPTGHFLHTKGNFCFSAKSLSMKHADAPESSKALAFILHESNLNLRGIRKQREALEERIGPVDCALLANRTVPIEAGCRRFPILQLLFQPENLLKCIGICGVLK